MLVGCYTLDLYCGQDHDQDHWLNSKVQFTGMTLNDCKQQARVKGWKIRANPDKDDGWDVVCPDCVQSKKKVK